MSTAQLPLYVLTPPFSKIKAKTSKFKRYWVNPFEACHEFVLKKKIMEEKKKKWGRKEFGMTSTPFRHALLGVTL